MKKRNENILSVFIVKVSLNINEVILNDSEDLQIKKLTKNDNIVKLIENNDIVLSTKNNNIMKSINYNNFMNTIFEFFTHIITD